MSNAHEGLRYVSCDTCLAIRSSRRQVPWTDHYFRALIADGVPSEVLVHAEMEMLHATHHDESAVREGEAVLMLGFRVILAHYQEMDVVPRREMTDALRAQFDQYAAQIDGEKTRVRAELEESYRRDLHELRVRVANVEALISVAFRAKHKTMRYDQVRAAVDWRTGDDIPEETLQEQRRLREAVATKMGKA